MGEMRLIGKARGVGGGGEIAAADDLADGGPHSRPCPIAAEGDADALREQVLEP
jgi:hypothetical protein